MNFKFVKMIFLLALTAVLGAMTNAQLVNAQISHPNNAPTVGAQEKQTQGYKLLTATDVRQAFEGIPLKPPTNKKILDQPNYNIAVARVANRNGKPEHHRDSDRIFFIKKGTASMRIGGKITDPEETSPGEIRSQSGTGYSGFETVKIKPGSILSVPRNIPYQIIAEGKNVSFIVVRMN